MFPSLCVVLVWSNRLKPALHLARIRIPDRDTARSVKSTGCPGVGTVKVTATGLIVPKVNAGIETFAFDELTSVSAVKPVPVSTASTVTRPDPAVIDWNAV